MFCFGVVFQVWCSWEFELLYDLVFGAFVRWMEDFGRVVFGFSLWCAVFVLWVVLCCFL